MSLLVVLTASALAGAAPAPPDVKVRVVPASAEVAPGVATEVAVVLDLPAGWHVYWENPGQSGIPTDARLTAGGQPVAGPRWTVPERFDADGIVNYGYADTAAFVFSVTPPTTGPLPLVADVSWLACREICVPGSGQARASLTVRDGAPPGPLAPWSALLPAPFAASGGSASLRDGVLRVTFPGPGPVAAFPSTALEGAWRFVTTPTPDGGLVLEGSLTAAPPDAALVLTRGAGPDRRGWSLPISTLPTEPSP